MNTRIEKITLTSVLTALVFVGTFFIKIGTPMGGYIHPGDAVVLLAGALLGPVWGSFAAGVGSAMADILGGYLVYAPITFVIKAVCAVIAALLVKRFGMLRAGIASELVMVAGYFGAEIVMFAFAAGEGGLSAIATGVAMAFASVPANLLQGAFGVVGAVFLYPALKGALMKR